MSDNYNSSNDGMIDSMFGHHSKSPLSKSSWNRSVTTAMHRCPYVWAGRLNLGYRLSIDSQTLSVPQSRHTLCEFCSLLIAWLRGYRAKQALQYPESPQIYVVRTGLEGADPAFMEGAVNSSHFIYCSSPSRTATYLI